MGGVFVGNTGAGSGRTVFRAVRTEVYLRWAWEDAWQFQPCLECLNAEDVAGPEVGRAELRWRFGSIRQPEYRASAVWAPLNIVGAYVRVVAWRGGQWAVVFHGVVEHERVAPWGNTQYTTGEQRFTAYDMKQALDRVVVGGSYTESGYVDEPLEFNGAPASRSRLYGNMGGVDADGANVFGAPDRGAVWDALSVLDYVFKKFVNYDSPVPFYGTGAGCDALTGIRERWSFAGLTAKQVLDSIVDRKRGLGYRVAVDEAQNVCFVEVFTYLPEALATEDIFVPANENGVVVDFSGYLDVKPEITFNGDRVDRVAVIGGPIFSTFTLDQVAGTLEAGWTEEDEAEYKAGIGADVVWKEDEFRRTERFEAVYQRFVATAQFLEGSLAWGAGDGEGGALQNVAPRVDSSTGLVYPDVRANVYSGGKRFERELPFVVPGEEGDALGTLRQLFGVCQYTEMVEEEPVVRYSLIEAIEGVEGQTTNIQPLSNGVGVLLYPDINHRFALNFWDVDENGDPTDPLPADTQYLPKVDWRTVMVTGRVELSERLKIFYYVPGAPVSQTGRIKLIEAPEAIAEYVVPGTVIDVEEGALVKHEGGLVRNDSRYLFAIAAQALMWYATVRASVSWTQPRISASFAVGQMVLSVVGPEGVTMVGSPITRRAWNFEGREQTTAVSTGYEELEYVRR